MHFSKKAQIAHLKADEAPIKIFSKHTDFADIFLLKFSTKFFEYTIINYNVIELVNN